LRREVMIRMSSEAAGFPRQTGVSFRQRPYWRSAAAS
jgi:hypothetical protein